MLYSQLYRSIKLTYLGLRQHPRYVFVASMPLLMCIPAAYANEAIGQSNSNYTSDKLGSENELVKVGKPKHSENLTHELNLKTIKHNSKIKNVDSAKLELETTDPEKFNDADNTKSADRLIVIKSDDDNISQNRKKSTSTLTQPFNSADAKKSLDRLSEFYQTNYSTVQLDDVENPHLTESAKNLSLDLQEFDRQSTSDINDIDNKKPESNWFPEPDTTINASDSAPVVAPNIFRRNKLNDASAYRCEGVWVSPNNLDKNSSYRKAITRAENEDGLMLSEGLPLYAQADYGYYDSVSYVELSGDVEVVQNGELITAQQLSIDLDSGVIGATGDVLMAEADPNTTNNTSIEAGKKLGGGLIAVADKIAYDTNSSAATASKVAFASIPMQAHGYAEQLNKPDDTHYELDKVLFSTCPPTNRKWQLEAEKIDVNTETGRGEAYDTTFRLGKLPVFYLPYFNFPIDDRRSSGLLTPSASIDSENGLKISVPYYLNLAPNFDTTVTTDIYTNRNPMLTTEFRYLLGKYGNGELKGGYLAKDRQYDDEDRKGIYYRHEWASDEIENLTADAIYNYVSDPEFINDFEDLGSTTNTLNLPRRAQVNYVNEYINGQLKVETFQSLKALDANGIPVLDKDKPYSRLPQLSVDYRLPSKTNINFTGTHDSAYFKKSIDDGSENEKSGVRIYNEIGASYPLESTWGYIEPKLSLQYLYTTYDEESRVVNNVSKTDNSQSIFVPKFSLDSGLNFYQPGTPLGLFDNNLGGYQLLSPRLKYTYSKFEDQSKIPNFNTRVASVDYDQLFSDSRFLGYDRIADNNNIAVGLNYRYIDAMGVTRFNGSIGDQYYLNDPRVALDTGSSLSDQGSSGLAWNMTVQPYKNVWFDFNGALNNENKLNFINSQVRYQPTPLSLLNLGYIKRKKDKNTNQFALSAITASALFPINNHWRVMAQGQYDNLSNKFIDSTVGLNYEDCCYGFSIYSRSYYNDLNLDRDPTRAVMAEFKINGLGENKSRLSKVFINKVPSFEPVDSLWTK